LSTSTIQSMFSESITGIDYSSGVFSLTSGYTIPLSASTTNWNTFYNTPSNRITAGDGIDWSGNTLNVSNVTSSMLDLTDITLADFTNDAGLLTNILGESFYDLADVSASGSNNRLLYQSEKLVTDSANLTFTGSLLNVIGTASSTSLVTANASTTNLTISGNSYLGTVLSGIWNGTDI